MIGDDVERTELHRVDADEDMNADALQNGTVLPPWAVRA
jgi:hypothetical protein